MDKYLDGLRSMRLYRQANILPTTSGSHQFTLENVASYTMELDVGDQRGFSTFTLRGVPVFLVDAFNFLRLNGLDASGIFRKEGNISRLKSFSMQTFFGSVVLPEDCTTHDVCSLIKRFFRELRVPLFAQMQTQLLDAASIYDGAQRINKLLEAVRMLPAEHLATLTFLMRQLKYFGDRHEGHQMTVENIARVFAPSLFRDNPPLSANKKKRGSQEDLISNVRNENELRIAIIVDLIDNAHKIGVPRDYYLASRRPSDVSQKIFKGKFMGCVGMRSVSAKPSSRNAVLNASVKQKVETRKEKKLEKQPSGKFAEWCKVKTPRERRSSSTVRDFFSNISNKVLRRGLSPVASARRRCSAGDVTDDESIRENFAGRNITTSKFCVRKHIDTCDTAQRVSRLKFRNEDLLTGRSGSNLRDCITSPSSQITIASPQKTGKRSQTAVMGVNICTQPNRKDDTLLVSTKSSRHRSRRESPRKSNTTNSRSKMIENYKVIRELKEVNMMPASPAFEPIEMTTKNISETFLKQKDSNEKLAVSKIIKRNSSKKLLQSVKIADSTQPFLEGYSSDKVTDHVRRRHTAPVKTSVLLKRNQPNSTAMGLKTPQSRTRGRYSTTLSLRLNGMDKDLGLVLEKKKRRSESVSGSSSDKISVSDGEDKTRGTQTFNAEALLEQKCMESRQRRAKRQKRREEVTGSIHTIPTQRTVESFPMTSLLDDVTNEINRLERDREVASKLAREEINTLLSDTIGKDHDLDSISTKEDISPSLLLSVPPSKDTSCSEISTVKENHADPPSSLDVSKHSPSVNTNVQSTALFLNAPSTTITETCSKTFHLEPFKRVSEQGSVELAYSDENAGGNNSRGTDKPSDFEEDFSKSDAIKIQLLNARSEDDIVAGPAYMPSGSRPSVLSIKSNNRGMVRQRVNHFARLGIQKTIIEQGSKTGRDWQDGKNASSSLQKLSAPPASHGLQLIAGNVSSPSREIVMMRAKKFEALATSVGMEACKNLRPATRNRIAKIQKQNKLKTPRRLSGEMRVTRRSQAKLDKSLEKLAVSLSNRHLLGRSPNQSTLNRLRLISASGKSEERRLPTQTSRHADLELRNSSKIVHSSNLKMIPETEHDI
ncbi:unnamed protein product [Litomosoides sigmodontis]|uniref:Rho-GAP domain-containing protein n=1 Tax=Litomosoides sigmodontis TaxID=42156 RepID=A0A3P6SQP9_LITSI|nr:unnamed protein product [Litomosoides sigmodontis]